MEEQRLRPMVENYNPVLFNEIYKKTEGLRRKLASQIDHRRFQVDYNEILSWFDVKFIFAYNKYCQRYNADVLLGHMITTMQMFKCRILRGAYTFKYSQTFTEFTGNEVDHYREDPYEDKDHYYNQLCKFLRGVISDNAYMVLQLQLHPPHFILYRLNEMGITSIHKIPDHLIAEYFDLGINDKSMKYIDTLKKEIKTGINAAKQHFQKN